MAQFIQEPEISPASDDMVSRFQVIPERRQTSHSAARPQEMWLKMPHQPRTSDVLAKVSEALRQGDEIRPVVQGVDAPRHIHWVESIRQVKCFPFQNIDITATYGSTLNGGRITSALDPVVGQRKLVGSLATTFIISMLGHPRLQVE